MTKMTDELYNSKYYVIMEQDFEGGEIEVVSCNSLDEAYSFKNRNESYGNCIIAKQVFTKVIEQDFDNLKKGE